MYMNSLAGSSQRMPPRREMSLQPILEKRRIIGSLRERTVYVQSPSSSSQNYQPDDYDQNMQAQYNNEMIQHVFNNLSSRINDHIERTLADQQISLDAKMAEIDEKVNENIAFQDDLEQRLKTIKKAVKSKTSSQPIETSKSCFSTFQPFSSTQTMFTNNDVFSDMAYSNTQHDICHNSRTFNSSSTVKPRRSIFTTLW